jgi:hypothetical protein
MRIKNVYHYSWSDRLAEAYRKAIQALPTGTFKKWAGSTVFCEGDYPTTGTRGEDDGDMMQRPGIG